MLGFATALPARRADLVFRPLGERGEHVVKDSRTGCSSYIGGSVNEAAGDKKRDRSALSRPHAELCKLTVDLHHAVLESAKSA